MAWGCGLALAVSPRVWLSWKVWWKAAFVGMQAKREGVKSCCIPGFLLDCQAAVVLAQLVAHTETWEWHWSL